LPEIHALLGRAFTLFALIVALWSLMLFLRRQTPGGNFWGTLVIGELLALVQAALGLIQWLGGNMPARSIHFLYGILGLLVWPATFAFTRGRIERRHILFWGLAGLFLFGLTLRASTTGRFQ
jgi:hypothetical protein